MLSSRASILGRTASRRRPHPALLSSAASCSSDSDRRTSNCGFAAFAAGITAVGGSALGLSLLSSSPSPFEPTIALADAGLSDPKTKLTVVDKKPSYLFGESYRRRVFFNYEKRVRMQSSPEKIFEYFASFRSADGEVFMSPSDLMRAVVPVFPPSESDIVREGYLRGERKPSELQCAASAFFMLFDTNNDGLISFPEEIDREEFKKVMTLMRSYNRQGVSQRDGLRIGLKVGTSVENGGLLEYFFGQDGKGRLQHDKFVQFLKDLHNEIERLEFAHYDHTSRGTISAKDFALSMVASADINHINKFLNRVDELDSRPHLRDIRITFEEFKAFAELRKSLQPLALAIFSYGKVNGLLTKQDFQRAASYVCGVSVTENVVDIIFHIFDANRDGNLSSEEFLRALQRRENESCHPTATGVSGLLSCWLNCTKTWSFTRKAS